MWNGSVWTVVTGRVNSVEEALLILYVRDILAGGSCTAEIGPVSPSAISSV